jgi:hypothetical protein
MMAIKKLNFLDLSMFLKLEFLIFNIYGARFNKYFLLGSINNIYTTYFFINRYLESKCSKKFNYFLEFF